MNDKELLDWLDVMLYEGEDVEFRVLSRRPCVWVTSLQTHVYGDNVRELLTNAIKLLAEKKI